MITNTILIFGTLGPKFRNYRCIYDPKIIPPTPAGNPLVNLTILDYLWMFALTCKYYWLMDLPISFWVSEPYQNVPQ